MWTLKGTMNYTNGDTSFGIFNRNGEKDAVMTVTKSGKVIYENVIGDDKEHQFWTRINKIEQTKI
jgi:hypothetical protein